MCFEPMRINRINRGCFEPGARFHWFIRGLLSPLGTGSEVAQETYVRTVRAIKVDGPRRPLTIQLQSKRERWIISAKATAGTSGAAVIEAPAFDRVGCALSRGATDRTTAKALPQSGRPAAKPSPD